MKLNRSFRIAIYVLCVFLLAAVLLVIINASCGLDNATASAHMGAQLQQRIAKRKAPDMSYPGQIGWLAVSGTDIDGPVMQSEDNEYYLRRDEAGKDNIWGCYFMDYECTPESQNLIVYGHSLEDNSEEARFSQLKRFLEQDFYKKNKTIELYYGGTWHAYEVFSAGYADSDADRVAIVADPAPDVFSLLLEAAKKRNKLVSEAAVNDGAQLLTLCTCTSDAQTRFVVTAVRIK